MKVSEEKIVKAACRLFRHRGIRSTSMQQVARACSISVWDVKLLFISKKELALAVVKHTLNKKADYLLISSSLAPSAVTELNTFFKFITDTLADLGPDILMEIRRYHPLALNQLRVLVDDRLIPFLQRNMERGISEGFYRDTIDSYQYASTYFYILHKMLETERSWSDTKCAIMHINDIFLHGVLNAKGMRV